MASDTQPVQVGALPETSRRKLSIRPKILLWLLGFTAVILALLWLSQVVFLKDIYQGIKQAEIRSTAEQLAEVADSRTLADTAAALAKEKHVSLVVYDRDGEKPLCSRQADGESPLHKILFQRNSYGIDYFSVQNVEVFCAAAEKSGGSVFHRVTGSERLAGEKGIPLPKEELILKEGIELPESDSATHIIYTLLSDRADGSRIAVLLGASVSPVQATVQTLRILLTVLSVLLVLLAIGLSFLISAKIAKPITRLTESAAVLATGNYGIDFDGRGYRETEELGTALDFAARELSKLDGLRRELIANVSHDLRTPLTMISGYAEVMRDIPGENTPENLQIVIDESDRLKNLVKDLLDLSKLQSGTLPPEMSEFSLTNAIESELTRYNKLRDREGYQIEFRYDRLVSVLADHGMIMQVVYNLVNNAVNYTGADKRVTVEQTLEGAYVRISVTDTGDGIAPDKLALIFDRYYREQDHKRATVGTGLGLSIVKGILETHGGRYGVTSALGAGSTFWFELPVTAVQPLPENE